MIGLGGPGDAFPRLGAFGSAGGQVPDGIFEAGSEEDGETLALFPADAVDDDGLIGFESSVRGEEVDQSRVPIRIPGDGQLEIGREEDAPDDSVGRALGRVHPEILRDALQSGSGRRGGEPEDGSDVHLLSKDLQT